MNNMAQLMQQAQAMQARMQDAQAQIAQSVETGTAGSGRVTVVLAGTGELRSVTIDPTLLTPDEGETAADGEMLSDLITAAHADAKAKLDAASQRLLSEAAGPLAGMAGLPNF